MRILVVGAGALGGYFGGRLLAAGRDVTFLVRPHRAEQLAATGGLLISSPRGDLRLEKPPLVGADGLAGPYDLILLGCKSFALDGCMRDMAPAVGDDTMILPVLNGMRHIDLLAERFGREKVLGGRCFIFAGLDEEGRVVHQGDLHRLDFGELSGGESRRVTAVYEQMAGTGFDATVNDNILHGMWEKWVMITTVAGYTCTMRATIGDIVRAGGRPFAQRLIEECSDIAAHNGYPPAPAFLETIRAVASDPDSTQSASMHKDMEKGGRIEADHIVGDLLARGGEGGNYSTLKLVYIHLRAYEERKKREGAWS